METIQIHRDDTSYSSREFQDKFPVGSLLEICTTIEVTRLDSDDAGEDESVQQQLLQ